MTNIRYGSFRAVTCYCAVILLCSITYAQIDNVIEAFLQKVDYRQSQLVLSHIRTVNLSKRSDVSYFHLFINGGRVSTLRKASISPTAGI